MRCEFIHEKNIGNDAYILRARMVKDEETMMLDFGVDESLKYGTGLYLHRFLSRFGKTFVRRTKYFLFGRKR